MSTAFFIARRSRIIEAAGKAQAEQIASRDPYLAAGVFELASVRGYRIAAMKPPAAAA